MKIALFQRDPLQGGGAAISTPRPLSQEDRIEIIDSLRGIALLGILLMNIPFFGQPHNMGYNLNLANEYSGPNYYTWWIVNMGFEGTMRAIFTILFGAGSLLLLQRLEKKSGALPGADIYYRRLIWLLIFGIINAFILLRALRIISFSFPEHETRLAAGIRTGVYGHLLHERNHALVRRQRHACEG
jgi:hypothetical protein